MASATIYDARTTLGDALIDGGLRVSGTPGDTSPPVVHLFGGGVVDLTSLGRGQVRYAFRIVLQPKGGTPAIESINLGVMVQDVLTIVRALPGWQVDSVTPDLMRQIAGAPEFLAVDITVSTMINL